MPLLDHTQLKGFLGWTGFHSTWAIQIMTRLNGNVLSDRHRAEPNIHVGTRAEVDVGTLQQVEIGSLFAGMNGSGGVAVAAPTSRYAPPTPALSSEVEIVSPDLFEVQVYLDRDGWQLVAAVELVSKSNKDREEARDAFAIKCASYLQSGVSVVVADVVAERLTDLHLGLCELLDLPESLRWQSPTSLSAVCYRVVQGSLRPGQAVGNGRVRLDVWPFPLAVGAELPTVPLWLAADLAVPLELELTYTAACKSLRLA